MNTFLSVSVVGRIHANQGHKGGLTLNYWSYCTMSAEMETSARRPRKNTFDSSVCLSTNEMVNTNPSWARRLWQHQTCEPWGSAAAESPVCPRSAPAPVWPARLPPPLCPSSWPEGPSARTPASPPSHPAHPSPGGRRKTARQVRHILGHKVLLQWGLGFNIQIWTPTYYFLFYLLHSVSRQFLAWPKHRPMILHCQMLQLRPHGLLVLWHHAERSSLRKRRKALKRSYQCMKVIINHKIVINVFWA